MVLKLFTTLACIFILVACQIDPGNINSSNSQSIEFLSPNQSYFLFNSVNPDYSASAISLVSVDDPRLQKNDLLPEGSDFFAQCNGEFIFHTGRFQRDRITKYHVESGLLWQIKTLDQLDLGSRERLRTANPQRLIFLDKKRALLPRFDSQWSWLLDLENGVKKSELSFDQYADSDGLPEMTTGLIDVENVYMVHNRIARLGQSWQFNNTAYLSKISLMDFKEYDFAMDDGFKGIPLKLKNFQSAPLVIGDQLFLGATGNLIGSNQGAGLEVIDIRTGSSTVHLQGYRIQKMIQTDHSLLVMLYDGWNEFNLHLISFDQVTSQYHLDQIPLISNVQDVISDRDKLWVLQANHVYQYVIDSDQLKKISHFKINSKMQAQSIQRCQY
jgi:hypothetical protein